MPVSPLAQRIAKQIADDIGAGRLVDGTHLGTQRLAAEFDVSRSPVRDALALLEEEGYLERRANRGYFVRVPEGWSAGASDMARARPFEEPNNYQRMADDWLASRIPGEVTETELRNRYGLTRTQLSDMLMRAVREGWMERKQGYGWRFLPVAKTPEAFEQIYRFRMAVEPAAMLEPTYRVDRAELADLRRGQEDILNGAIDRLPAEALLDRGAQFHETLIGFSGNPYFQQALVRANRLRRLLEYRSPIDRRRLYAQCADHLEIISLLDKGDVAEASSLLRRHLGGALRIKSPVLWPSDGSRGDAPPSG